MLHENVLIEVCGYKFRFVQELNPKCDKTGKIIQFMPQTRYKKHKEEKLNLYGSGSFCKFTIPNDWSGKSGVYALFNNEDLLYIGKCVDLRKRFNAGYGNISPKNCYIGGQSTNCKINAMILEQYKNGNKVVLYFYETKDSTIIENRLINKLKPMYNG